MPLPVLNYGHILDTDVGSFEKTLEVNLRGYFFMSVYAGKRMKAQRGRDRECRLGQRLVAG